MTTDTMDCREIRELLHDWVDGELDEPSADRVEEHAASCETCRRQANAIRRLKQLILVKTRRAHPPAGFGERVREQLVVSGADPVGPPVRAAWWQNRPSRQVAALLLAAVLLSVVSWSLLHDPAGAVSLVHADTAREVLRTHCQGPCQMQRMCLQEANAKLHRQGIHAGVPLFDPQRVRFSGLAEVRVGENCRAYQLFYETCKGRRFSVFVTPAPVRHGPDDSPPDHPWHPGCCLCVRGEDHSVICFRASKVHYWVVTDGCPDQFWTELLEDALARSQ